MSIPFQMMQDGYPLGRIAGIRINANQSAAFLALMLALNGFSLFGFSLESFFIVPLFVVLFLGSLLAHELGHALTARQFGIATQSITLHGLGGVAKIKGEPRTAKQEFLVAIAGPAVSFFLAGAFHLVAAVSANATMPIMLVVAFLYLSYANLVLGVFNMLPGLPLDGGRILRAAVWHFKKDRNQATLVAARGGEILGLVFYGLAFMRFLSGDLFGAIFTAFMGWFLRRAAGGERRAAQAQAGGFQGASSIFDLLRTMQQRAASPPNQRGGFEQQRNPFSRPKRHGNPGTQGMDDVEEIIRFEDGREVIIRRKK